MAWLSVRVQLSDSQASFSLCAGLVYRTDEDPEPRRTERIPISERTINPSSFKQQPACSRSSCSKPPIVDTTENELDSTHCKGTTDSVVCFPFILPTFFSPEAYLIRYLTFRRKCKLPDLKEWQDQRSILRWGLANGESVVLDLCFRNPLLLKRREEISSAHSYPSRKTAYTHCWQWKRLDSFHT